MATVAEKVADGATLIDDMATTLSGLASWSDADTYVVNDSTAKTADDSGNEWHSNGRVFHNADMGLYVLFYLERINFDSYNRDQEFNLSGLRIVVSTDWDGTEHHPAGKTNVDSKDPFSGDVSYSHRDFLDQQTDHKNNPDMNLNYASSGVWWLKTNNYSINDADGATTDVRTVPLNYFLSAGNDYLNVSAWCTDDANHGIAGSASIEYVDNKFWNDSLAPVVVHSTCTHQYHNGYRYSMYGFEHFDATFGATDSFLHSANGFDRAKWGFVNPDANDDTFFFERPVIYASHNKNVPTAYVEDSIINQNADGGSHGDIISFNGTDYRVMKQSGGAVGKQICLAHRFE